MNISANFSQKILKGPNGILWGWGELIHGKNHKQKISSHCPLKVPKREIFDRSDFPDFYTIKSLRVGDFGVKIKKI
jgi:hypothetical protein